MRNKHREKRLAQEHGEEATEGIRLRSAADPKGDLRTGRLRGWSDSDEGCADSKPKRKKRRTGAVPTAVENELEEAGHFHAQGTHLGQPGTYEEPPIKRQKAAKADGPREKKKKGACEKEAKVEVKVKSSKAKEVEAKEERLKEKKKDKKKRKKDHAEYPDSYSMMSQTMLAPMMSMMRYPMMPGMMMMPGGLIGAPLISGVGPLGMHGAPTMPYPLPGVPMVRPAPKAPEKKKEEKRRRFTETPAPPPAAPEPPAPEVEVAEAAEEGDKRSGSVSSSSSSSTSEAKNEGQTAAAAATVGAPTGGPEGPGEGELELGLISPEPEAEKEEHSPLQVPPGMESPVASPSPKEAPEEGWPRKPSSWVEVEGETMEELQRELEVTSQTKPCVSVETQTEEITDDPDSCLDLADGLEERWFLGFVDAMPAPGAKESSSSDSSEEAEDQACRPQRQLRRRSRSHSQAPGPEGTAADGEASSSSSSSSSSSGGSCRRQRAPSSDEEAAKAQSAPPETPPMDPRRLRVIQDYSDVV